MKILFLGDICGRAGRCVVQRVLPNWISKYNPDIVIANGENAAGGFGLTKQTSEEIFSSGVDVITLGNHTFSKKEVAHLLEDDVRVLRPLNYPKSTPGYGYGIYNTHTEQKIAVINLLGRVFLDMVDNPFERVKEVIEKVKQETDFIFIDFHAEATSEKAAMAWMLDGVATAIVGTHTHVQTADERILPNGTAFLSDAGMCGPLDSILGVKPEIIVDRMLNFGQQRFEVVESGPKVINGVLIAAKAKGQTEEILRLSEVMA